MKIKRECDLCGRTESILVNEEEYIFWAEHSAHAGYSGEYFKMNTKRERVLLLEGVHLKCRKRKNLKGLLLEESQKCSHCSRPGNVGAKKFPHFRKLLFVQQFSEKDKSILLCGDCHVAIAKKGDCACPNHAHHHSAQTCEVCGMVG
jgi:hypothetical protein